MSACCPTLIMRSLKLCLSGRLPTNRALLRHDVDGAMRLERGGLVKLVIQLIQFNHSRTTSETQPLSR